MRIFHSTPAAVDEWPYTRADGSGRYRYPGTIGEQRLVYAPRTFGPTGRLRAHEPNHILTMWRENRHWTPEWVLATISAWNAEGLIPTDAERRQHARAVLERFITIYSAPKPDDGTATPPAAHRECMSAISPSSRRKTVRRMRFGIALMLIGIGFAAVRLIAAQTAFDGAELAAVILVIVGVAVMASAVERAGGTER